MKIMQCRKLLRFSFALAAFGLLAGTIALRAQDDDSHHGRKYKAPPLSSRIEVTVLRDSSGKPIEDAHVIFHPIEGDKDKGALELKTNEDGKIVIDVIPIGDTVRLQVIANGFQTYGEDYKVDKPEMSMEVRMKRPGQQYSIYKNSSSNNGSGSGSSSGKPSGSSNPPDAQPNASQPQQQPK
jgi:5-hydroxyisourate hydrolase-like protein (transthyretin family)